MAAVPVQQRGGVGGEAAVGAREDRRGLAQADPLLALAARSSAGGSPRTPPAPTIGTRPSRGGSSSMREHRAVGVDAEQQRLGAVELGQRDELEPVAGDPQPAVAGDDGARAGMRALLGEPLGVAAARVPRAVERGSRERVLHPLDVRRTRA